MFQPTIRAVAGILVVLSVLLPNLAWAGGLAARCAALGNDDTIRSYQPSLRPGIEAAFQRRFPGAGRPSRGTLRAQTHIRCMDGQLLVCFTGANLPCGKIDTDRANPGAEAFCRDHPQADAVPAYATGHDTVFGYRCRDGKAKVSGRNFPIDARGFASTLWTPID
ncbi:hypothetical protein [Rhodopila sp.]|jgi:hypothetical protein|uniref:hypothetical protein n=1 Tax=Rhodopila sp. TaxID=2480087 RepID=UPI002CD7623E|nr:hypothetical protein [Rhodopila sp.]HVZ07418.1 hypothetical protein [Rhodopila sp.]